MVASRRLGLGILFVAVLAIMLAAGCLQAPPQTNKTNQTNKTVPPGYEVADYCKADSDCVRLTRCCDCGLGVYVNRFNQKYPDCAKEPVCECADIKSVGKCQNGRCVGAPAEMPPPPQNDTTVQNNTTVYEPRINPPDFSANVTNRYFSLVPGKKMTYEGETEDGTETNEVFVTNETKMVMGVKTIVVWDRVWLDGDLIEDTRDWYAQDKDGNVWYFGEESKEMAGGIVTSTEGSWEAGIDGAKPGIIMEADPKVNDSYRQEYYKGVAEDMADVLALNQSVSVPYGNLSGCLKTRDWTPLEQSGDEHKYYCPSVGGEVMEVGLEDNETSGLLSVQYNAQPSPSVQPPPEPVKQNITEDEARDIALKEVPGRITDVTIERKFGKLCYVVEIDADSGPETDVIIDIETGEVLGLE